MDYVLNGGQKRVAVFNDLSCLGRCSLTVALPIISAYGIETVPLPTALLSTHTGGFENYRSFDLSENLAEIIKHFKELSLRFDCIYTGYFCTVGQIEAAREFIANFKDENTLLLVDPVMGDNGKLYAGFDKSFAKEMLTLCRGADIVTPNLTEMQLLCGENTTDFCAAADFIGAKNTVITGIADKDTTGYFAKSATGEILRYRNRLYGNVLHGCGDVFASALCGECLCGTDFLGAVRAAADFCFECVEDTVKDFPTKQYGLHFEKALRRKVQF